MDQGFGGRLCARQRPVDRRDLRGPVPAVVAQAVYIDAVVRRVRVDLEVDRLAMVKAELRGEALDGGITLVDQPFAFRRSLFLVFEHDRVDRRSGETLHLCGGKCRRARRLFGWVIVLEDTGRVTGWHAVQRRRPPNPNRTDVAGTTRARAARGGGRGCSPVGIPTGSSTCGRNVRL